MRAPWACLLLLAATAAAALDLAPPPFRARPEVAGEVRVWSSAALQPLVESWQRGFVRDHPRVRFENRFDGSDVAMAGLYTGAADIAIIGRTATAPEVKAFEWIYRYRPEEIAVALGSVEAAGRSPRLVAYVHADNPLAEITLAQLDAAFSRERLRGAPAAATWGDLGLRGEWAAKPIRLYGFDTESGSGRFFREAVLKDSRMLHWDRLTEFADSSPLRTPTHDAGAKMLAALARDPSGLAVASGPAPPGVKAVRFVEGPDALARTILAYVNHRPQQVLDAPVEAFLGYVRGTQGQRDVAEGSLFRPLAVPP